MVLVSVRARKLRELIEALDGYRIGRYTSLDKVERLIHELGLKLPYSWEEIRKDVEAILALPRTSPEYKRVEKMDRRASLLTKLNLLLLLGALLLYAFRFWQSSYLVDAAVLVMVVASLVIANVVYYIRAYATVKVSALYAERLPELEKLGHRIKAVIEYLIRQLRRELKVARIDPREYRLKLWLPDYSGIEIVKKPSRFSSKYEVIIKRTEKS